MSKRIVGFLLCWGAVVVLFSAPLLHLMRDSLREGYTSHVVLIPAISAYLVWSNRDQIFSSISYGWSKAAQIAAGGVLALIAAECLKARPSFFPFLIVFSALLFLVSGFAAFWGTTALRKALFPACLLALMLPIPTGIVDRIIHFLQAGSTELTYWMFQALSVPVLRDGFILTVPGVSIEVATECSGINSSTALLIVMLLVAHEALHTAWARVLLVLIVIPLSLVKNAIRIVTLTLLATRVDPGFLTGRLHHEGGFVFFLIALALLYPVVKLLQTIEGRTRPSRQPDPAENHAVVGSRT